MANYYCGFRLLKNTKTDKATAHILFVQELRYHGLIDWLFDKTTLNSIGVKDDIVHIDEEMIDISLKLPNVLLWVDTYAVTESVWRDYYLNGISLNVDAVTIFPEPEDWWLEQ